MVGEVAMLRHRQHPSDWLSAAGDHQLSLLSDQLTKAADIGAHLTDIELFHRRLSMCCNSMVCSTKR